MQTFLDAGVNITMVQVGNELSNGLTGLLLTIVGYSLSLIHI